MSDRDELAELRTRARRWVEDDPDPKDGRHLTAATESGDLAELRAALGRPLEFGTAGIRGPVGPGPARMNRATVIRVTHGLARHVLTTEGGDRPVVVGFDARPDSATFARDTIAVLVAAGLKVAAFTTPVPTPVVAHVARRRSAAAAVVVTASHNPAADNGYKVYGSDGIQIVPPADGAIAAAAANAPGAAEIPRAGDDDPRIEHLGAADLDAYLDDVLEFRVPVAGRLPRVAYSPLHGVAGELTIRALRTAGHDDVHVVAAQAEPDGRFPTLSSPNPEDPATLAAVLGLAEQVGADVALANDPDGDRLAVAVPGSTGALEPLTGNEVGVLLGDHLLRRTTLVRPVVASSIVSSPMLADVASAHGARHESSLTGFKWICRAAAAVAAREGGEVLFGYEEALGYAVGTAVLDKDGISAAVVVADLVAELAGQGHTLIDQLDGLYARHGLWISHQAAAALTRPRETDRVTDALDRAGGLQDAVLGPRRVAGVIDHRRAVDVPVWRGPAELVEVDLADGGRALVRPSGTEPKVKVYIDLRARRDERPLDLQRRALLDDADQVAAALLRRIGLSPPGPAGLAR